MTKWQLPKVLPFRVPILTCGLVTTPIGTCCLACKLIRSVVRLTGRLLTDCDRMLSVRTSPFGLPAKPKLLRL